MGEVDVGHGLRFHPLGGVDDEKRPFAGGEAARDFVGEIDVAGRVEEVKRVFLAVFRGVAHRDRVGLDRDPALPFEVHRIEKLVLLLALLDRARGLEQTIRQAWFCRDRCAR